ncbi:MAG: hypothetical protein ACTSUD_05045 [Alphaproteobacteria bacterium]
MSAGTRYVAASMVVLGVFLAGPTHAKTPPLVGSWRIVKATGSMSQSNKGQTYNFKKNGTMNISGVTRAKYGFDGKVVTLVFSGSLTMKADITFKGRNNLVYRLHYSDQVFTMKRK